MQTEILNDEKVRGSDPLLGQLIDGKYRVDKLIGVGGMGKVYRGTNVRTESPVAIKTLIPDLVRDETLVRRFEVEAKSASNLRHPNTIRIYDFGREGDLLFMVMELLDGYPLEDATSKGEPLDPSRVIHIFRQTCKSLAEAHDGGMVHRDLKPDNIFLNRVGGDHEFVKVLDFGVAKLQDNKYTDATLTQAGMIFGTPRYMSPEQARAEKIDCRSDIYALGVILYECLTGKAPFDGRDPISILIQHVNEQPKPFAEINPELPAMPDLEAITMRCLRKSADERYDTVLALLDDLERVERRLHGLSDATDPSVTRGIEGRGASVTRRQGAATQHTPSEPFDRLGVAGAADPTFQMGEDSTLLLDAHRSSDPARSSVPLPAVIAGVAVLLVVVAAGLYSLVAGDPEPATQDDPATATAAAEGEPAPPEPIAEPEADEPVAPPRVEAAVQLALASDRLGGALRASRAAALEAVVVIDLAPPEGIEGATWRLAGTDAEPQPLPAQILRVRGSDTPDTLRFVISASGYRDAELDLPFASTEAPVVPTLRRPSSGSSSSGSSRTDSRTQGSSGAGGLANPYGP